MLGLVEYRAADAPPPEGLNEALGTADAVRLCLGDNRAPARPHEREGRTPVRPRRETAAK